MPVKNNKTILERNYAQSGQKVKHNPKKDYLDRWPVALK